MGCIKSKPVVLPITNQTNLSKPVNSVSRPTLVNPVLIDEDKPCCGCKKKGKNN